MSKKSNFNNMGFYVNGQVQYPYNIVGQFNTSAVYNYSEELRLNSNDDSDYFYAGEPVQLINENNEITVKTVTNTEIDLKTIKFNAVITPFQTAFQNAFDKTNKYIAYKAFRKDGINTIQVTELNNNERMNVKTLVVLDPNTKITFAFDENGVLCVKNAEAGDTVYGISKNIHTVNANEIVVVEFNFKSTETIPVND